MDFVEHLLEAETSSIFEVDPERGDLFFRLARGEKAQVLEGMRLRMGEGVAGQVALTEEPVLSRDTAQDPRFCGRFDQTTGFTTRSILCVPLKSRDRLVGVLEVLNKRAPEGFDDRDLEILTLAGNLIGTALENARLYSRLQERLTEATAELQAAQKKLLRSERLAALGMLARGVAHEVRNPVAIICGLVHRLQKHLATDDPQQAHLSLIVGQARKLERMVGEIEAFTRLGEPVLQPVRLAELASQVLAAQAEALARAQIRVVQDFPSPCPPVPGDPALISLALTHLVTNAREAMPAGGRLTVALTVEPIRVRLSVGDSGQGIAAADLPKVYDPFFSTKPQGTGMGLPTVFHIIANHLGELEIASEPGVGTTVHLWLPRWRQE
jgi:signal transduction histidine kinase